MDAKLTVLVDGDSRSSDGAMADGTVTECVMKAIYNGIKANVLCSERKEKRKKGCSTRGRR